MNIEIQLTDKEYKDLLKILSDSNQHHIVKKLQDAKIKKLEGEIDVLNQELNKVQSQNNIADLDTPF